MAVGQWLMAKGDPAGDWGLSCFTDQWVMVSLI